MDSLIPVVMIFSGIVVGAVVVWLLVRAQSQRSYEKGQADSATQVAALQERLGARDQEVQKLQQSCDRNVAPQRNGRNPSNKYRTNYPDGSRNSHRKRSTPTTNRFLIWQNPHWRDIRRPRKAISNCGRELLIN